MTRYNKELKVIQACPALLYSNFPLNKWSRKQKRGRVISDGKQAHRVRAQHELQKRWLQVQRRKYPALVGEGPLPLQICFKNFSCLNRNTAR